MRIRLLWGLRYLTAPRSKIKMSRPRGKAEKVDRFGLVGANKIDSGGVVAAPFSLAN
jgi:hypothetical protein